jgi:hypothetical protein
MRGFLEKDYEQQANGTYRKRRKQNLQIPNRNADLESGTGNGNLATKKASRFDRQHRISIRICHRRHRLTSDYTTQGLCNKYLVDALVSVGVLTDDSAKFISETTESFEQIPKSEQEETIVTLTKEGD